MILASGGALPRIITQAFIPQDNSATTNGKQLADAAEYVSYVCTPAGVLTIFMFDAYGDGWGDDAKLMIEYIESTFTTISGAVNYTGYQIFSGSAQRYNTTSSVQLYASMPNSQGGCLYVQVAGCVLLLLHGQATARGAWQLRWFSTTCSVAHLSSSFSLDLLADAWTKLQSTASGNYTIRVTIHIQDETLPSFDPLKQLVLSTSLATVLSLPSRRVSVASAAAANIGSTSTRHLSAFTTKSSSESLDFLLPAATSTDDEALLAHSTLDLGQPETSSMLPTAARGLQSLSQLLQQPLTAGVTGETDLVLSEHPQEVPLQSQLASAQEIIGGGAGLSAQLQPAGTEVEKVPVAHGVANDDARYDMTQPDPEPVDLTDGLYEDPALLHRQHAVRAQANVAQDVVQRGRQLAAGISQGPSQRQDFAASLSGGAGNSGMAWPTMATGTNTNADARILVAHAAGAQSAAASVPDVVALPARLGDRAWRLWRYFPPQDAPPREPGYGVPTDTITAQAAHVGEADTSGSSSPLRLKATSDGSESEEGQRSLGAERRPHTASIRSRFRALRAAVLAHAQHELVPGQEGMGGQEHAPDAATRRSMAVSSVALDAVLQVTGFPSRAEADAMVGNVTDAVNSGALLREMQRAGWSDASLALAGSASVGLLVTTGNGTSLNDDSGSESFNWRRLAIIVGSSVGGALVLAVLLIMAVYCFRSDKGGADKVVPLGTEAGGPAPQQAQPKTQRPSTYPAAGAGQVQPYPMQPYPAAQPYPMQAYPTGAAYQQAWTSGGMYAMPQPQPIAIMPPGGAYSGAYSGHMGGTMAQQQAYAMPQAMPLPQAVAATSQAQVQQQTRSAGRSTSVVPVGPGQQTGGKVNSAGHMVTPVGMSRERSRWGGQPW